MVGGKQNALRPGRQQGVVLRGRRRRTLPPDRSGSTIRATRLNDRVRDGNGCDPRAIDTDQWVGIRDPKALGLWEAKRANQRARRSGVCVARGRAVCNQTGQATRAISTARLRRLPVLHLRPINVLVSNGPSEPLRAGKIRLGGGFPLRCFQRFSRPNVATRRYPWQNSRYTRGQSVPVLSY